MGKNVAEKMENIRKVIKNISIIIYKDRQQTQDFIPRISNSRKDMKL